MKRKVVILSTYVLTSAIFLTSCRKHAVAQMPKTNATISNNSNNSSLLEESLEEKYEKTFPTLPEPTEDKIELEQKENERENKPVLELDLKKISNNTIVFAKSNLNIRSSNSEEAIQIGMIEIYDTAYKILSCENGWDLIKYNEIIGYVKSDYLEYTYEEIPLEERYIHTPKKDIVVTTSTLNFRIEPNAESKRIRTFDENTELEVLAEVDNGWLLVRYNGEIGYVSGSYVLSILEIGQSMYPELDLKEIDVKKIVYPNTGLNIREGIGIEFDSIGLLEKYETLRVLEDYGDWYLVLTNDRTFGFVSKQYVEEIPEKCIVVDKSCQQLYFYENHKLLYTTPVTTGKDESPSDTGLFKILTKAMYVTLTDNVTYWSDVIYWLRYNGGEGIHDADWRRLFNEKGATYYNTFGSESYHTHGSHGCINTPYEIVEKIYHRVEEGDRVLVHK